MADYFIRIYVPEELNPKMDALIASPDAYRSIPDAISGFLTRLDIPQSTVEWDLNSTEE